MRRPSKSVKSRRRSERDGQRGTKSQSSGTMIAAGYFGRSWPAQIPAVADCSRFEGAVATVDCARVRTVGGRERERTSLTLNACVSALLADRGPPQGEALYGRWGEQQLRVSDGRVTVSGSSDRATRTLVDRRGAW